MTSKTAVPEAEPQARKQYTEDDAKALLARLITPASPGMRSLLQLLEGR